jgi:hypothetical protein
MKEVRTRACYLALSQLGDAPAGALVNQVVIIETDAQGFLQAVESIDRLEKKLGDTGRVLFFIHDTPYQRQLLNERSWRRDRIVMFEVGGH